MRAIATYSNEGYQDDGDGIQNDERKIELEDIKMQGTINNEDYNPYIHRNVKHPLTNTDTLVHLLKIALGTGIFAMPNAFNHAGYVVPSLTYPLIAEAALLSGPNVLHKYAVPMIHVVNAFTLVYEIGTCCIYIVFMASNFKELTDYFFDTNTDIRLIMLYMLLPLIVINWTRNLKYLAPFSTVGTLITIASISIVCYYIFREPLTFDDGKQAVGSLRGFPFFFGNVLFALEAIAVIMPLENEMKSPEKFVGLTGILNRSMCLVIALYAGIGLCGYLKYGSAVKSSITLNLPQQELLSQAVKTMISCGVFISNAVVAQVAIDLAWTQYVVKRLTEHSNKLLWEYVLRTGIVCITFLLAVAIPNLDLIISLLGALTLSMLGLTMPAFFDCCTRWHLTFGLSRFILITKNVVIAFIGLAGLVIGTTISMNEIIRTYF
ncbi:Proton-coupled amino acid transporter-like protein, partial [Pseudolycoriella hygida]